MFLWVPFGWIVHKKQLENASCNLTRRGITIRKGWIFKAQQNIPLDKLTDISIHEGPVLNLFGIVRISIETAGATPFPLIGLNKSTTAQFRDIVMAQRDSIVMARHDSQSGSLVTSEQEGQSNDVLIEIRDILQQINANLLSENNRILPDVRMVIYKGAPSGFELHITYKSSLSRRIMYGG